MTNEERAFRFKKARTELNPKGEETLAQVHDATGVAASTLSELENPDSSRNPGSKTLSLLAEHYRVNAAWLAGQSDSWSLNDDLRAVTDQLGLSPLAVEKLRVLMADEANRDAVNSLIESEEFDRLIRSVAVLSDYTGAPPMVPDTETVDYAAAVREHTGKEKHLAFEFAEGDIRSFLSWKVSRDVDALIGRMMKGDK